MVFKGLPGQGPRGPAPVGSGGASPGNPPAPTRSIAATGGSAWQEGLPSPRLRTPSHSDGTLQCSSSNVPSAYGPRATCLNPASFDQASALPPAWLGREGILGQEYVVLTPQAASEYASLAQHIADGYLTPEESAELHDTASMLTRQTSRVGAQLGQIATLQAQATPGPAPARTAASDAAPPPGPVPTATVAGAFGRTPFNQGLPKW